MFRKKTTYLLSQVPKLDHRAIGLKQKLFFFNDVSQGSCFFEPRGARVYNKLMQYMRDQYRLRGYHEVITPNIYNCQLWKQSGHWDHYKDNMIRFKVYERDFSLKPMNCPGHCVMFQHQSLKTKDQLPVRWADFGVLHRNELSGSLTGLTRVRRFQQDDAHIFCTPDQIDTEVLDCLLFTKEVYSKFGFTFNVELSLRPESYLGDEQTWDMAEQALRSALVTSKVDWVEHKAEGAFYGPKIDLKVQDCFGRHNQCATIQLDFQMPEKFDLQYKDNTPSDSGAAGAGSQPALKRPVMIHRAILGSLERFIAMVAENCCGRWPFWMSPLQLQIVPVHPKFNSAAVGVCEQFRQAGLWADCDAREHASFNAKLREAQLMPYNVIAIVGQRELDSDKLTVRVTRDKQVTNLSIETRVLLDLLKEFENSEINRADLELLARIKAG